VEKMINDDIKRNLNASDGYCCFYQSGSKETWSWIKLKDLKKSKKEYLSDSEFIALQRDFLHKKNRKPEEKLARFPDK
jgi:hypothetical protein